MNVEFLEAAREDLSGAVDYYNAQKEGLGFAFSEEVQATLERILEHPRAWPSISSWTKRCRT